MVSNRELEEVVAQINRNFDLIFSRLEALESVNDERPKTSKGGSKRVQQTEEDS